MPEVIDGAAIAVLADLGATRPPFVLDRDLLDAPTSTLTPADQALTELTAEVAQVDGSWGATDWQGPLTMTEAGELSIDVYDPARLYDPANDAQADPPTIGRLIQLQIDGEPVFTGRVTLLGHDWAEQITTIQATDAIGEASGVGVTVHMAPGTTGDQLAILTAAAGWPASRVRIEGALTVERTADDFTGTYLEGLRRLQAAELGALFADAAGVIVFRGRGAGPPDPNSRQMVGMRPGVDLTSLGSSSDWRIINRVLVEPLAGSPQSWADEQSISEHGERSIEVAAADLLLA